MHDEAQIHVGVERPIRNPDGTTTKLTINLSRIPASAGPQQIEVMMGTAQLAIDMLASELEFRAKSMLPPKDPVRVDPAEIERLVAELAPKPEAAAPRREPKPVVEDYDPFDEEPVGIPSECDIRTSSIAFGIEIDFPPYEWLSEPITEEPSSENSTSGQMTALNAGLSNIGWGGKMRHDAAELILQAYGPIHDHAPRAKVDSLKDLSKAEAHILLSWLEKAGVNQITALWSARGQSALI